MNIFPLSQIYLLMPVQLLSLTSLSVAFFTLYDLPFQVLSEVDCQTHIFLQCAAYAKSMGLLCPELDIG